MTQSRPVSRSQNSSEIIRNILLEICRYNEQRLQAADVETPAHDCKFCQLLIIAKHSKFLPTIDFLMITDELLSQKKF